MLPLAAPRTFPPSPFRFSAAAEDDSRGCCPNALSEQLLEHMLDCDACLTGSLEQETVSCPVYEELQKQIAACGRPTKPLILAY